jgi:hypothetical protein
MATPSNYTRLRYLVDGKPTLHVIRAGVHRGLSLVRVDARGQDIWRYASRIPTRADQIPESVYLLLSACQRGEHGDACEGHADALAPWRGV